MIKETIDSLEDRFAKAADDRKGLADEVKIVETRRDADTVMSQQKMQKIGKDFLIICFIVVFEKCLVVRAYHPYVVELRVYVP